jgi:hypothetical protein
MPSPRRTINTIQGVAEFVKTEVEDAFGRFDDSHSTRDGFYLLHEGKKHHVYKVRK